MHSYLRFAIPTARLVASGARLHARRLLLAALPALCLFPWGAQAGAGGTWEWRNPRPQGSGLKAMAESRGRLIATGRAGTILTTTDGMNWTPRVSGTRNYLRTVAASGATVVAAGRDGDIVTSTDGGLTWRVSFTMPETEWSLLIHGRGTWVAAGFSRSEVPVTTLMTSPDGLTWTPQSLPDGEGTLFSCAVWTGTRFVLSGPASRILTSDDGTNWTPVTFVPVAVRGMVWTGSRVVAAGSGGISVSPDGMTWSEALVPGNFEGVLWSGGQLLAWPGDSTQPAYTSPAGKTWTPRRLNADGLLPRAAAGTGHTIVLGTDGGRILHSSDNGLSWKPVDSKVTGNWNAMTRFAGRWVAAGGDGILASSSDGKRWVPASFGTLSPFSAIAWHNGLWVAGGVEWMTPTGSAAARRFTLYTSTDGLTWTDRSFGNTGTLASRPVSSIINAGSRWVATAGGDVLTSPDGITWQEQAVGTANYAAAWNGSRLAVAGVNNEGRGQVHLSDDGGITWESQLPGAGPLFEIAWTGNGFVAAGSRGQIYTSPTGAPATWTRRESGTFLDLLSVTAAGEGAVAVGGTRSGGPVILTSPDGVTWTPRVAPTNQMLFNVSRAGALYVATGYDGVVLTSPDAVTWTLLDSGTTHELYASAWDGRQLLVAGEAGAILANTSPGARVPWRGIRRQPGHGLTVRLTWPAAAGRTFDIESTTLLTSPWLPVPGSPRTAAGVEEFFDFTEPGLSASPKRFFRIWQRP